MYHPSTEWKAHVPRLYFLMDLNVAAQWGKGHFVVVKGSTEMGIHEMVGVAFDWRRRFKVISVCGGSCPIVGEGSCRRRWLRY